MACVSRYEFTKHAARLLTIAAAKAAAGAGRLGCLLWRGNKGSRACGIRSIHDTR